MTHRICYSQAVGDRNDNHFVPQFYLRYWSADEKRTNLFNFSRMRAIEGVSIRDQCQRHNFYAFAPELEKALSELEGKTAFDTTPEGYRRRASPRVR